MKHRILIILAVFTAVAFLGCKDSNGSSKQEVNFNKDASYALGLNIGSGLRDGLAADGIYPNINEFMKGMKDGIGGKKARFDLYEAMEIIETAFDAMMSERNQKLIDEEKAFLAENARKPEINITSSGLQYEILTEGNGPKPTLQDKVLIHYEGKFTNGQFFDSSFTRGFPAEFELDYIIQGWAEGLQLMPLGSKYRFYIPSDLGYGDDGIQGIIPPFSTLVFDVELLEIRK